MPNSLDLDRWRQIARKHGTDLRGGHAPAWLDWDEDHVLKAIAEAVAEERERCAQAARNNKPMPLADFRRNTLMLQSWCADGGKELIDGYADYLSDSYVRAIRQQPAPDEAAR